MGFIVTEGIMAGRKNYERVKFFNHNQIKKDKLYDNFIIYCLEKLNITKILMELC